MEYMKYDSRATSWNTGVLDIFSDPEVCVQGMICPFYIQAKTKATVEGRPVDFMDMVCCPSTYFTRQQIRHRYGLGSSPNCDCLASTFLWQCVLCQHYREQRIKADLLLSAYTPSTIDME